ncbi:hypothetical protein DESC_740055 [Desulfosarcina cetonica]|nr:hypothetical protein DESC_740055 [Desulfosarcina cetonica]
MIQRRGGQQYLVGGVAPRAKKDGSEGCVDRHGYQFAQNVARRAGQGQPGHGPLGGQKETETDAGGDVVFLDHRLHVIMGNELKDPTADDQDDLAHHPVDDDVPQHEQYRCAFTGQDAVDHQPGGEKTAEVDESGAGIAVVDDFFLVVEPVEDKAIVHERAESHQYDGHQRVDGDADQGVGGICADPGKRPGQGDGQPDDIAGKVNAEGRVVTIGEFLVKIKGFTTGAGVPQGFPEQQDPQQQQEKQDGEVGHPGKKVSKWLLQCLHG